MKIVIHTVIGFVGHGMVTMFLSIILTWIMGAWVQPLSATGLDLDFSMANAYIASVVTTQPFTYFVMIQRWP